MKLTYAAVAVSVVFSLGACSTAIQNDAPLSNSATPANQQSVLYKHLQSWLPGFYSDYTQVSEAGGTEDSVTDLTVRQLPT